MDAGTSSTVRLSAAANRVLEQIFREGIEYKKAGVIFSDIRPSASVQFSLFDDQGQHSQDAKVMKVMDAINARMGRNTLKVGACGNTSPSEAPAWEMQAKMRTPCYTTRWADLLKVK